MRALQGKVAVVTGASKGIGAGIARAFGEAGAAVVVNYASDEAGAARVVADIVKQDGRAVAVRADVSKSDDAKRLVGEAKRAFGRLDVLVNNAGIYRFQPIEAVDEAEYRRQFDVNVLGPLLTTREAVAHFGPDGGAVINIGSVASRRANANAAIYTGTKSALDGITLSLALELAPRKIRVNSLNPGFTDTEGVGAISGGPDSDFVKAIRAATPLGRAGLPEDIGRAAVYLASDASAWQTGEILWVGGGLR